MILYLANDDSASFAVKVAAVESLTELTETGSHPVRFARLSVEDWDGAVVEGIVCDRFGDPWSAPSKGIPKYIRLWLRRKGETFADLLARARSGDPTFSWFILCEDLATAQRFALAE